MITIDPINISNMNLSKDVLDSMTIYKTNQRIYIEDICMPYVQSLDKAYIAIAIFNVAYSFTHPLFKKFKDVVFFEVDISGKLLKVGVKDIMDILDVIFYMLNFFAMGYWLLLGNLDFMRSVPIIGKWIGG